MGSASVAVTEHRACRVRLIHRYWTGDRPPPAEPWLHQVIARLHPGDPVRDWVDATLPPGLVARLDVDPLAADPRHRANVARWWLLRRYGGIWLDHDVIPLRPLPRGVWTASLGRTRTGCAIRVPVGHGLPEAMLDAIDARPTSRSARPVDVSGDHLLQRVAAGWPDVAALGLPFDAVGAPMPVGFPWAVHLWATSSVAHLKPRS